ncbi:hypothetical protein [Roseospira navarrensis]|uniref:Uncharacterized protein n=1 Tax=Roseospira navarrensis TaxID=140058 RepID=A0A7X2D3Q9_9PROT|nr:hypothetical protein [Roseospira navarrensis]MQX35425.1 hypothetical protein [Roseospira navarrensis]
MADARKPRPRSILSPLANAWRSLTDSPPAGQRPRKAKPKRSPSRAPRPSPKAPAASPDREALIAEAMRIHRAKRAMLEDLGDEDRILLEVLAHHLLVETPQGNPDPGSSPPDAGETRPDGDAKGAEDQSSIDGTPRRPQGTGSQPRRR